MRSHFRPSKSFRLQHELSPEVLSQYRHKHQLPLHENHYDGKSIDRLRQMKPTAATYQFPPVFTPLQAHYTNTSNSTSRYFHMKISTMRSIGRRRQMKPKAATKILRSTSFPTTKSNFHSVPAADEAKGNNKDSTSKTVFSDTTNNPRSTNSAGLLAVDATKVQMDFFQSILCRDFVKLRCD